jgi:hypothetical protein
MTVPSKQNSLESVYEELHELLSDYAPPFVLKEGTVKGKRDLHLQAPQPVIVPGAYSGSPKTVGMASIILQKGYVGLYFLPIYLEPGLAKKLSPELRKLLKGKTCFYVRRLTPELKKDVRAALEIAKHAEEVGSSRCEAKSETAGERARRFLQQSAFKAAECFKL